MKKLKKKIIQINMRVLVNLIIHLKEENFQLNLLLEQDKHKKYQKEKN